MVVWMSSRSLAQRRQRETSVDNLTLQLAVDLLLLVTLLPQIRISRLLKQRLIFSHPQQQEPRAVFSLPERMRQQALQAVSQRILLDLFPDLWDQLREQWGLCQVQLEVLLHRLLETSAVQWDP